MAVQASKLRILYLLKILREKTDENHSMTANDLCKELKKYELSAERKSIYNDIDTLKEYGIDIVQQKGVNSGYYIASREFELPELKLLVDAVQSSKFITSKKSQELIRKLEMFASKVDAEKLHRQVYIFNRPKTDNETIYYNVDYIHAAIGQNKQIEFRYGEWTEKKEMRLRRNGALYRVSPWALTWDDENYYLIAYEEESNLIKHYRVDKMKNMAIVLDKERLGKESFKSFDIVAFSKKTFGMYGGRDEKVTLLCRNELAGVVIDRFGQNVWMSPYDKEHFKLVTTVSVSRMFYGWLTGVGQGMVIVEPESVKIEYKEYLEDILKQYEINNVKLK